MYKLPGVYLVVLALFAVGCQSARNPAIVQLGDRVSPSGVSPVLEFADRAAAAASVSKDAEQFFVIDENGQRKRIPKPKSVDAHKSQVPKFEQAMPGGGKVILLPQ
ncbi:MAG: hypothetical protein ACNA7G_12580 [Methylobacter sp.]